MTSPRNRHRSGGRPIAAEVDELVAGLLAADRAAPASVDEAIARLTSAGMAAAAIAARIGVTTRTVTRRRAGLRAPAEGTRS
jgi:DNA-binding NarL/FixJ family response regulator